jgi:hypothetical protein
VLRRTDGYAYLICGIAVSLRRSRGWRVATSPVKATGSIPECRVRVVKAGQDSSRTPVRIFLLEHERDQRAKKARPPVPTGNAPRAIAIGICRGVPEDWRRPVECPVIVNNRKPKRNMEPIHCQASFGRRCGHRHHRAGRVASGSGRESRRLWTGGRRGHWRDLRLLRTDRGRCEMFAGRGCAGGRRE